MTTQFSIKSIQFKVSNALFTATKLIKACNLQMNQITIDDEGRMVIHIHARSNPDLPAMEFIITQKHHDDEVDEVNFVITSDELMYPDLLREIAEAGITLRRFKSENLSSATYSPAHDFVDGLDKVGFVIPNHDNLEESIISHYVYDETMHTYPSVTLMDYFSGIEERKANLISLQVNNPSLYYSVFQKLDFKFSEDSTTELFTVKIPISGDYEFFIIMSKLGDDTKDTSLLNNTLVGLVQIESDFNALVFHI